MHLVRVTIPPMPPKQSDAVKEILKRLPLLSHRDVRTIKREVDKILLKAELSTPSTRKKTPASGLKP